MWVRSLGWDNPLVEEMATHSSILAWKIPWTKEPGRLQSMGSQKSWTWQQLNNNDYTARGPVSHSEMGKQVQWIQQKKEKGEGMIQSEKEYLSLGTWKWNTFERRWWVEVWSYKCMVEMEAKENSLKFKTKLKTAVEKWLSTRHFPLV